MTFHCIVPKLLWEWDEKSSIHMRFEGSPLGEWKHNLGDFMDVRCAIYNNNCPILICSDMYLFLIARDLEDDLSEMICTLIIDADILKSPLAYKYVIFSPKMTKEHQCFEFLHSFAGRSYPHENPNRCLRISVSDRFEAYGGNVY